MLDKINYTVPLELIQEASQVPESDQFRYAINEPKGYFFYDQWQIKPEFKDTVWDKILQQLPVDDIGEARIISLKSGTCYLSHADIDDRYHLNISGDDCCLIDIANNTTHDLIRDGNWYVIDAGRIHSAANFGRVTRVQLVVRRLLKRGTIKKPIQVRLTSDIGNKDTVRYLFDKHVSPWLNYANKRGVIDNFDFTHGQVDFTLEKTELKSLQKCLIPGFVLTIL